MRTQSSARSHHETPLPSAYFPFRWIPVRDTLRPNDWEWDGLRPATGLALALAMKEL
jgi:hypothetical protein